MTIYIAGKIEGDAKYLEKFEAAENEIKAAGHKALNPARQQQGMSNLYYARVCLAMMESADAVYFLPDWVESKGAKLEKAWCEYVGKEIFFGKGWKMCVTKGE